MPPVANITINDLDDTTYVEGSGIITVDGSFSVTGGDDFTGGFVEYSITGATCAETLGLETDLAPSDVDGVVTIVGTTVYRGTGAGHEVIGSVSATDDGEAGQPLRINFTNEFENGDFQEGEDGQTIITGWTTSINEGVTGFIHLDGVDQIAGQATPIDTTYPGSNTTDDQSTGGTFTQQAYLDDTGAGDYAILLDTGASSIGQSFGVIRGPYVYSNGTVALEAGDTVAFDWKALAGGDDHDAYGYIVDVNTGDTITILDSTGDSTNWATQTVTIGADEGGTYRFVFVAGSYDATGGQYVGGQLQIDDVTVTQANPPDAVTVADVSQIIDRLTYENTADDFATLTRTLNITVEDGLLTSATDQSLITITPVNDAPTFVKGADQVVDEDAGLQTVAGWATAIVNPEAAQTLSFVLSSDNSDLFSIQPIVNANGNLVFKSANDAYGTATVSVYLQDNGGTANGGDDTSAVQTFTITVVPVDAPPLTGFGDDVPPADQPGTQAPQGDPAPPPSDEPAPEQQPEPDEPEPEQQPDPEDLELNPVQAPIRQPPAAPPAFDDDSPQVVLIGIPLFEDMDMPV